MFAAVARFGKHVSLTVVGRRDGEGATALDQALARHQYIPSLPHHEVLALMRRHDALLFPALAEGFGLVITEAMSQGTPVITNNRTAGRDLIISGENGLLVEASSEESLAAGIERLLVDRTLTEAMGRAAMQKAATRPWSAYRSELVEKVKATLITQPATKQA